jgi:hypothetical protein
MRELLKYWLLFFAAYSLCQNISAQETKWKWKLTGSAGIYGDFYSMTSDTAGAVAPRRPDAAGRFMANATLSYGEFSMPVSLMLSPGQSSVVLPNMPSGNFIDYIRNPMNRIGIAPKYKWAQLMLGTQVPQYSELSVGDLPVFGAGINLSPGKFRFGVFAGTSQLAIQEDTSKNIQGIYARNIYSAKIGYGNEDASHAYFIASMMEDDTTSLHTKPVNTMPQKGVLTSLDYKIKIGKQYSIKGEIAGSAFTRNTQSNIIAFYKPPVDIPPEIFRIQESSRFDYASALSIAKEGKYFRIKVSGKYIGDGFVPLGYPFMQTDRAEITVDPGFTLFKNKIQFSGSIGRRINNLSGVKAATTTQTIGFANINYQCTERLSFAASFNNFSFRNSMLNDTFRIDMVTLSWSFSPTYTITTPKNMHVLTAMYSQNAFTDFNTISGALSSNDSHNALFSYIISKIKNPLSISSTISYFDNNTSFGFINTNSLNFTLGYKFFKKKLNTTTGVNFSENKIGNSTSGSQIMTTLGLKYTLKKKIDFSLNGSINIYKYGSDRPGISYRENLLRTAITYKF